MRVLPLPVVPELRDGSILALGDEDGVEAKAFASPQLVGDSPFEDARAPVLGPLRRDRHQLAHVAGPAAVALDALELLERALRLATRCPTGRPHAGAAAEALDLDARVLAEHPAVRREAVPELGLRPRVLEVGLTTLRRVLLGIEQLERPAVECVTELSKLVLVLRSEDRADQVSHRTPSTGSRRISSAVTDSGCACSTRTSSATRRRSRASSTSNARTSTPRDSSGPRSTDGLSFARSSTSRRSSPGRMRSRIRRATIRSGQRLTSTRTVVSTAPA